MPFSKPRRTFLPRTLTEPKLLVASHNKGKVREIAALVEPFGKAVVSAGELELAEPVEPGMTFIENAEVKALAGAKAAGLPALADDSGLSIHALDGEPGVYSARWGGPKKDFTRAMGKVHEALEEWGIPDTERQAHFTCALSLAWPDGHCETFEGKVYGQITWPARGDKGFGYDPIFIADGYDITFGEMEPADKHAISHRARAFAQLVEACLQ
ncbi:MAG: RdgB/HAM1 family non-canonical purine NTP pyrophosphatase [Sphingomonadales bacterium]